MAYRHAIYLLFYFGTLFSMQTYAGCNLGDGTFINMRTVHDIGVLGRFRIPRDQLETVLTKHKQDKPEFSDAKLRHPPAPPQGDYDDEYYGEILAGILHETETYFDKASNANTTISRRLLILRMPIVTKGTPWNVFVAEITDNPPPFPTPYNDKTIRATFEYGWTCHGQAIVLRMVDDPGDSVFRLTAEFNAMCLQGRADDAVREHFDSQFGNDVRIPDYDVMEWMWGCQDDATAPAYCDKLEEHRAKIEAAEGDLSVHMETVRFRKCEANYMSIDKVTGKFLEMFPYLESNVTSFETEFMDGIFEFGITYPSYE